MMRRTRPVNLKITDELVSALAEALPCGDDQRPVQVRGWPTGRGTWNRVVAHYPNSWTLTVFFRRNGEVSSCRAHRSVIAVKVTG